MLLILTTTRLPDSRAFICFGASLLRRASFFACRLDKHLYVIGGRNESGYLSSVESYNLETNEWNYVSSLPQPLAAHAGAVHNGKIYISGGQRCCEGPVLLSFICYRGDLMLSEPSRSQEEQPVRYTLLSSVRFRRSSQWRVCFVALLLRPRNGRVGSQTGYEHKARHSRAGRDERPPVRHRWKSPERYTWEHFTNEAENRSTLLGLFFSKAVWKRSHYEKVNSVRYGQLLFHTFKKQKKKKSPEKAARYLFRVLHLIVRTNCV